jgi:guanylate kinase
VFKEIEIGGLKKLKKERPDFDPYYSTIFLNIPKEKLKERIEQRGVFMSDEEYNNRMKSAQIEEEELAHICDYTIDATLTPDQVLQELLKIVT